MSDNQAETEALELDELKALCAEATPGPWYAGSCWVYSSPVYDDDKRLSNVFGMSFSDPERQAEEWNRALRNVAFIAAARSAVPALIAEVERLTQERDTARDIAVALEQELVPKDQALDEIKALHVETPCLCGPFGLPSGHPSCAACADDGWPCETLRVLTRLDTQGETK